MIDAGPILLFDGECALCVRSVRFILRHEGTRHRAQPLRFASLQGETGRTIRHHHPVLDRIDSVVWYDAGSVFTRSTAVLTVLRYLGGFWRVLAAAGAVIPMSIRDRAYDYVARSRRRWFGAGCLIPSASERDRFLP